MDTSSGGTREDLHDRRCKAESCNRIRDDRSMTEANSLSTKYTLRERGMTSAVIWKYKRDCRTNCVTIRWHQAYPLNLYLSPSHLLSLPSFDPLTPTPVSSPLTPTPSSPHPTPVSNTPHQNYYQTHSQQHTAHSSPPVSPHPLSFAPTLLARLCYCLCSRGCLGGRGRWIGVLD